MRAKQVPLPIPTNLYVDQLSADPGDISWKSQFYHLKLLGINESLIKL